MILEKTLEERHWALPLRVSSLEKINISPRYFKDYIDGKIEEETKDYFELGTALHMYLLERDKFRQTYVFLDFTKPKGEKQKQFCEELLKLKTNDNKLVDIAESAYKTVYVVSGKSDQKIRESALQTLKTLDNYLNYRLAEKEKKSILNFSTFKYIKEAAKQVEKHQLGNKLIFKNDNLEWFNEQQIYWEYPNIEINREKLVISSTLDRFTIDHENKVIQLIDVKTTSSLSGFQEKFLTFKYHRQLAAYWHALMYYITHNINKKELLDYKFETYIVAVQSMSKFGAPVPIECRVFPISEQTLNEGWQSLEKIMNKIAWHIVNDKWDYTKDYYENKGLEKNL
jgi:hypothetical protein